MKKYVHKDWNQYWEQVYSQQQQKPKLKIALVSIVRDADTGICGVFIYRSTFETNEPPSHPAAQVMQTALCWASKRVGEQRVRAAQVHPRETLEKENTSLCMEMEQSSPMDSGMDWEET